jgi:type I restriction enzyme S subunit
LTRDRSAMSAANANLRRTRDLLLPRLVSGKLDVENIEVRMNREG